MLPKMQFPWVLSDMSGGISAHVTKRIMSSPINNPLKKRKGWVVFQGNQVTNQSWEAAIFQDLGSSPATMEASRVADMWGCCPGHRVMQADAPQAYIQTELLGT